MSMAFHTTAIPTDLTNKNLREVLKNRESDVSNLKELENILGRTFELQKDVFVRDAFFNDEDELAPPGQYLGLPYSLEEYQNDPENWQNTDTNAQNGHGLKDFYHKDTILGVVEKGTRFIVKKVVKLKGYDSDGYFIKADLDHQGFDKELYDVTFLFEMNYDENGAKDGYLFAIDPSLIKEVE